MCEKSGIAWVERSEGKHKKGGNWQQSCNLKLPIIKVLLIRETAKIKFTDEWILSYSTIPILKDDGAEFEKAAKKFIDWDC